MQEVLIDRDEFIGEGLIQVLNDFKVCLHDKFP